MHALEFSLNGKRVCVASPGDDGLVISHASLVGSLERPGTCDVQLRVGGVREEQHLEWIKRSLALGDTVEIRVIDAAQSDPPARVELVTEVQRERLRIASGENAA